MIKNILLVIGAAIFGFYITKLFQDNTRLNALKLVTQRYDSINAYVNDLKPGVKESEMLLVKVHWDSIGQYKTPFTILESPTKLYHNGYIYQYSPTMEPLIKIENNQNYSTFVLPDGFKLGYDTVMYSYEFINNKRVLIMGERYEILD